MTIPSLTSSQDEDEFVEFKSSVLGKLALVVGKNASSATDRDWFRGNRPRHPRPDHLSLVGRRARQHRQGTKARLLSLARIPGSGICCPMCPAIRASAISHAPRWAMAVWGASTPVSSRAWRPVIRQPLEFARLEVIPDWQHQAASGPAGTQGMARRSATRIWFLGVRLDPGPSRQWHLQAMASEWPFFQTLLSNMDMVLAKSDIRNRCPL